MWKKEKKKIRKGRRPARKKDSPPLKGKFGDLLFSVINAARLYGVNPDNALERTNAKFISRFNHVEKRAKESGRDMREMTLAEMDSLWNEAKEL